MPTTARRRSPEELLRQVQAEEAYEASGRLKIFVGYASGVGKSFRMLDEGRRRSERGQDVVVGAIQPVASAEIQCLLENLEVIPLKIVDGVAVMDIAAIIVRHPSVCLVDGLAYDNPPGFARSKRWQDVQQLLDEGISVISSINIQYIEDLGDRVERITRKHVEQTVPQSFINTADEIVVVDAPAEMCEDSSASGTVQKLSELREIALLLAADVVDRQLEAYLERNGLEPTFGTQERILVCITPRTNAAAMIDSARRNAQRFHGDLFVAYVSQPQITAKDQASLEKNLAIARDANAQIEILDGEDPVETILQFARARGITQIFVGHSIREKWWERVSGTLLDKLIRRADGIDVRVFPH